jgi:hypothetical protein
VELILIFPFGVLKFAVLSMLCLLFLRSFGSFAHTIITSRIGLHDAWPWSLNTYELGVFDLSAILFMIFHAWVLLGISYIGAGLRGRV